MICPCNDLAKNMASNCETKKSGQSVSEIRFLVGGHHIVPYRYIPVLWQTLDRLRLRCSCSVRKSLSSPPRSLAYRSTYSPPQRTIYSGHCNRTLCYLGRSVLWVWRERGQRLVQGDADQTNRRVKLFVESVLTSMFFGFRQQLYGTAQRSALLFVAVQLK